MINTLLNKTMSAAAIGPLGAAHPDVRKTTLCVCAANSDPAIDAIETWVDDNVGHVADPTTAETVLSPIAMIEDIFRDGSAIGDVDDRAVLVAAMGRSIGLDAQFVLVRFEKRRFATHVFTRLKRPEDEWAKDPVAGKPFAGQVAEWAAVDVKAVP